MVTIDQQFDSLRDFRAEDVDQRLAIAITWRNYDPDLRQAMLLALANAAAEALPPGTPVQVRGSGYHVGPMAQGLTYQMIFTAVENVQTVVDTAASWIEVGAFAILVIKYARDALRRRIKETGAEIDPSMTMHVYLRDDAIVLSQSMIRGLCEHHFDSTYGRSHKTVSADVTSRSPDPEIVWAGRPNESIVYVVRIWTGQTSYVYVVDGRGKPIEHISIRGRKLASLPLPDWFGR